MDTVALVRREISAMIGGAGAWPTLTAEFIKPSVLIHGTSRMKAKGSGQGVAELTRVMQLRRDSL